MFDIDSGIFVVNLPAAALLVLGESFNNCSSIHRHQTGTNDHR